MAILLLLSTLLFGAKLLVSRLPGRTATERSGCDLYRLRAQRYLCATIWDIYNLSISVSSESMQFGRHPCRTRLQL